MSSELEGIKIQFSDAEIGEEKTIISLVKEYDYEGDIEFELENFSNFLYERMRGLSGKYIIYTPCAENHVSLYTQIYTMYTSSNIRNRREFLGFCSLQQRFQLGFYPVAENNMPHDLEIPWFFVVRNARFSQEEIAKTMMKHLLKEIAPNQIDYIWAYCNSFDPPTAWWQSCLEDAGFERIEANLTHHNPHIHPDGDYESLIYAYKLKIEGEKLKRDMKW